MKKIIASIFFLIASYISNAQKIILLSDSVILKPDNKEMNYDLLYTISDASEDGKEYNVTITDNTKGTAIPGKDYDQKKESSNKKLNFDSFNTSPYRITLRNTSICDIENKTIVLHVKAIPKSGDTTYRATLTLTIHRTDASTLPKDVIKKCKDNAKQMGINWFGKNKIERNVDATNTIKTEFVSYTDLKGFDPDAPNGLAQNQFLFKWPIEKHWVVNHEKFKLQYLRSFLFPNFLLNRIDKTNDVLLYKTRFDSLDTNNNGIVDSFPLKDRNVNSFDVIKYSNMVLNGKLTLITIKLPKSRVMFEYDLTVYRMRVDTSKIGKTFDPIYAISHGPHLFFETGDEALPTAFQLRVIFGYEVLRIRSNTFSQVDGISSSVQSDTLFSKTPFYPYVKKSSKIWALSARLSRSISKDDKTSIFFRFNLSWQKIKNNNLITPNIVKSFNQYAQFQLGLNLDINAFGGSK